MIPKLSNISFKSTPLYDVKVKKKGLFGYHNVDATISLYNPDDVNDIKAMEKSVRNFGRISYAQQILDEFREYECDASRFYVLELKNKKPIEKRVLSLCECFFAQEPRTCYIDLLQSITKSTREDREKYKGAGEVIIYGVIKEAKKEGMKNIELTSRSSARPFYRHIGFFPIKNTLDFILPNNAYEKYINRIDEKYGVK